ncbi:hypothetical protein BOX15_Mlig022669g1 [Macrostomum lignano]|uniref:Uncharacterized protein n=1 Tax=Macrostomum lignano TaxID=282301 RepID=A0A267G4Z2_9PLAT|nr:hypothetical protein BOX15_Mlig022669g1 [Macrostomum lignano]
MECCQVQNCSDCKRLAMKSLMDEQGPSLHFQPIVTRPSKSPESPSKSSATTAHLKSHLDECPIPEIMVSTKFRKLAKPTGSIYGFKNAATNMVEKVAANPLFDKNTVLTDLTYSLCCIPNLPVRLTSYHSVRGIYARYLMPDEAERKTTDLEEKKQSVRQMLPANLREVFTEEEFREDEKLCVTELAISIADGEWAFDEEEAKSLLQNSAEIVRSHLQALKLSTDQPRDRCPVAEAWFCLMVTVWSRLRTVVTEPEDEAEKFKACMGNRTVS